MNKITAWYKVLAMCLLSGTLWAANGDDLVEKKKNLSFNYKVSDKDKLVIDNQFGDVRVSVWDKNEIKIEVQITANASTDGKAEEYINSVEIQEARSEGRISLVTDISKERNSKWNSWNNNKGDINYLQIDYQISMPENALNVEDKFGDIVLLSDFKAPLRVDSEYGTFTAKRILNPQSNIDVQFGKATIDFIEKADLKISYSNLKLRAADNLTLDNQFGKLWIEQVDRIYGKISYSSGSIGTINETATLKVSFSSGFKVNALSPKLSLLDIDADYSSMEIPSENLNAHFDVTTSYGNFSYPHEIPISFTKNTDKEKHDGPVFTKHYVGKIGTGNGNTKLKIKSDFGNVRIR